MSKKIDGNHGVSPFIQGGELERSVPAAAPVNLTPESAPPGASSIQDGFGTDQRTAAPSTKWKEVFLDGSPEKEQERFAAWAREHAAIQSAVGAKLGTVMRGQHAGSLGDVRVRLEVLDNIPAFAKHGLFKEGATFDGVGRFSSSPGVPSPDDASTAARGLALSLKGPGGQPQDFLFTNLDFFVKNMEEVMTVVRAKVAASMVPPEQAAAKNFEVVAAALGPERAKLILGRFQRQLAKPVTSLATESYFSAMPIKVGPYVAKFGIRPLATDTTSQGAGPSYLKDDLRSRLTKGDVSFEFFLQFYENDQKTPIEDLTSPWDVPSIPVAKLTIPRQDLESAAGKALQTKVEASSFSPWHTKEHEPVGEIGRARKAMYDTSAKTRGGCPFMHAARA